MDTRVKMRVRVMKYAHYIYHNSNRDWSNSLSTAWQIYFCMKFMCNGSVKFYYRKQDGTIRCAFGKLNGISRKKKNKLPRAPRFDIFVYYDLEKDDFRCFKTENFIAASRVWTR